ncbi:MAG: SpoVG family protein [Lachnospiraceae bacterium]|nr:SpoVG family protein [Lachnospiraceae bacterium]
MKYDIKITKLNNDEWSTKAFVTLTFEDSLKIADITIREAKNSSLFVAMPGYKTSKTDEKGKRIHFAFLMPLRSRKI